MVRVQRLTAVVITVTVCRLAVNMTRRFSYPFVPVISDGLGVTAGSVQSAIAAQSGIGIASPLFGPFSEQYGRKRVMVGALVAMTATAAVGAIWPTFAIFALALLIFGVGKMIYDPVMQAYLGDQIPYQRRGLALGFTELSWAGALIVIAPLAGVLLVSAGLRGVMAFLALALGLAVVALQRILPPDHPTEPSRARSPSWHILRRSPAGLAALAYSFAIVSANEIFFINYGLWMDESFDLAVAALGTVTVVIAAAEVVGEFLVIGLADRLGKRRLAMVGAGLSAVGYFLLPQISFSLPLALFGLFLLFVCVETAIVASIPLFTEILPEARAVMMSGNVSAHAVGRLVGALIGGGLYALTGDFVMMGAVSMALGLGGFGLMYRLQEA